MTDKKRKMKREEFIHEMIQKNKAGNKGAVDVDDIKAMGTIASRRMAEKGVQDTTVREMLGIQQAVLAETGADKSLAEKQMILREEARKKRGRGR